MNMNWNEFAISAIGDVIGGGTPSTKHNEYYGDEIAWITPKDLSNFNGRYISRGERSISQKGYDNSSAQMMPAGTVLFSSRAPIGYVAIAKNELCTNQGFKSVVPHPEICDSEFLYYLLCYRKHDIEAIASGTTFMEVSGTALKNFVVHMPDISTQKKIASVLSSLDQRIEGNNLINHNLEEQLYALYASNYDNLSGKKVPLKECCSFQEGYVNPTQTKPEYFDGSVKWLRAVDINESFIISTSRTLTEQGFASAGKSALLFPKDSIAISKSGTIGRLGIVADNMCGNRAVINIVPKQKKWLAFIYCYLKSRQAEFSDLAVGSVQKNLYVSILEPLEIFSPADSVLNDFHFSAQTILEKMKNNCFEMQSLAQLRDALLPKLMSGEIDVSEVEV